MLSGRGTRFAEKVIDQEKSTIIIPDVILVEIDYLLREFLSIDAELDFINDLTGGSYKLESLNMNDFKRCQALIGQYRNLDPGLADSAVIAAAERLKIYRILTVDVCDFRVVRPGAESHLLFCLLINYGKADKNFDQSVAQICIAETAHPACFIDNFQTGALAFFRSVRIAVMNTMKK